MAFWNKDNYVGVVMRNNPLFHEELGDCIHHIIIDYILILVIEENPQTTRIKSIISVNIQYNFFNFLSRVNNYDHDIDLIIHQKRNNFFCYIIIMQSRIMA